MSEKNYDPLMHSAEHILNQTMVRMFGCGRSFNSHIERKKSKCDYRISQPLTQIQVDAVEKQVNEVINTHYAVTEEFLSKSECSSFLDLSKLPADAPEILRVVRIGDYDACACIGPHVRNTAEIEGFKITSHDFNEGIVRLRFKLGN